MDKKKVIAVVGALLMGLAGFALKEDVKGLVCGGVAVEAGK